MRYLPLLSFALALAPLVGCQHHISGPCYSGVVLGETCLDGTLIQVDAAYPIGRPAVFRIAYADSLAGTNVVAAVNDLGTLGVKGQRIYFSYSGDTQQPGPSRICTANTVRLTIPHLAVTNLSATTCAN